MRTLPLFGVPLFTIGVLSGIVTQAQQPPTRVVAASTPTFTRDVAPILFNHCAECHRPGEIAPMSLLTFDQARPYATAIAQAVRRGTMPPWHADAPAGTFQNERILNERDRQILIDWAGDGAPRGEVKDLPAPPSFTEGWTLGQPDVVFEMDGEYAVPASGEIAYQNFYIPTSFTETKWVQSFEVRPGDRSVVHHVLVRHRARPRTTGDALVQPNKAHTGSPSAPSEARRPISADLADAPSRLVATYAPGTNPQRAPRGTAFRLDPGGALQLQIHYTTTGRATTDRTKVGIIFLKEPPRQELLAEQFLNRQLKLPAGAADVAVSTDLEFLQDAAVWGLFPHTHLRGKKWHYTLQLPNGEVRTILSVPTYDFNWQTYYMFKEPLQVPKGSRLISTAWYDNSRANKANPDPTKEVTWGDQTWEEMQYTGVLLTAAEPPAAAR